MKPIEKLEAIMETLRSPRGCPWDREQTHQSLKQALIEECYELIEAIESTQDDHIKEELGDLLLHVLFHSQIAKENKRFEFNDVINVLINKLITRHPHVFHPYPNSSGRETKTEIKNSNEVLNQWEKLKAEEKQERTSALDGIPPALPALMKAQKIQELAKRVGFEWSHVKEVLEKVEEEIKELKIELKNNEKEKIAEELGDLFFSLVNLSRFLKLNSEELLNSATKKFDKRFRQMEKKLTDKGKPLKEYPLVEMETVWEKIKMTETKKNQI